MSPKHEYQASWDRSRAGWEGLRSEKEWLCKLGLFRSYMFWDFLGIFNIKPNLFQKRNWQALSPQNHHQASVCKLFCWSGEAALFGKIQVKIEENAVPLPSNSVGASHLLSSLMLTWRQPRTSNHIQSSMNKWLLREVLTMLLLLM